MKKFFICLLLFCAFFVCGCSRKLSTYHEISYAEYNDMISNGESFPLVVGSSTCSACSIFKPTMESFISKYQVDVRYIDISKLSQDESKSFLTIAGVTSTPTTIFFKDGKQTSVYYRIVGAEDFDGVVAAYKRMGYIGD